MYSKVFLIWDLSLIKRKRGRGEKRKRDSGTERRKLRLWHTRKNVGNLKNWKKFSKLLIVFLNYSSHINAADTSCLMSLDICIHPWNNHHSQCNRHVHHLQDFFVLLIFVVRIQHEIYPLNKSLCTQYSVSNWSRFLELANHS